MCTINLRGTLRDLSRPLVMGILNVTPDSFYADSRCSTVELAVQRAGRMLADGADIIDVGACSTRPDSTPATAAEEWQRLSETLPAIRESYPDAIVSLDTFRADIAARCVREFGVDIVNDISGGTIDTDMFAAVAELRVPYVLTHNAPQTDSPTYVEDVCLWLAQRADMLHQMGVADVIADPGFGFGKSVEQNFGLLRRLSCFRELGLPLLVGVSRKSMIWRTLGCTPADSLTGTIVLNTLALQSGADILRVHDVLAARQTIDLLLKTNNAIS